MSSNSIQAVVIQNIKILSLDPIKVLESYADFAKRKAIADKKAAAEKAREAADARKAQEEEDDKARKLAAEIVAASKEEGAAVKKKEYTHRMAEANKAFSHFKVR